MPAVRPDVLVDAILDAFQDSGASGLLLSAPSRHPRRFAVQTVSGSVEVWVYAWTLTHGGRPSLPDEYRIQMTTVTSPLPFNPKGYTILLGYEPNLKMFGGFDLRRHHRFTTGSPSVQIDIKCIHKALQDGLAFDRKDNDEIAVGVRPDQIVNYIANASELHRLGASAATYGFLVKASALQAITEKELARLPQERRKIVSTINRFSRAACFRQQVLTAYGYRCAVSRLQLRLVDAAHILPVGAEGSTDEIQNGLALSPTFHRAFDNGLVFLDENYIMRINPVKELQLVTLRLDGGLSDVKSLLDKRIHLPPDRRQWPKPAIVHQANEYRRISV
ncbi:HNH endonuclease [Patescibacteria group bacterium]|nr:HNH endonuclease [Patescibacteria group bacterium]